VTDNHNPKITTNWQAVKGEPSPFYRKLWDRLLANKKRMLPEQASGENKLTGGAEEGRPHKLE